MPKDFIARDDEGFDSFQKNFMTVLLANATAWNIPPAAVTALVAYQATWTTAFAVGGKAQRISREMPETKAKSDARNAYENSKAPLPLGLRAFIAACITYNPLVSNAQRIALGVPVHKTTKTTHKVATENLVVFKSKGIGGGAVRTDCHTSGSPTLNPVGKTAKTGIKTSRDKKEPGYDIMKSWKIIAKGTALPATANDAGMTQTIFTNAKIIQQLGPENEGMLLCEFLRWYISKHPELAGPWSDLQTTIIT